jgi:hypothetical protein
MRRLRQRTIEPVFDSLLQHYGMRRVNTRGRSSAHKTMLLTAVAFNLQKLLKHQPKKTLRLAIGLPILASKGLFLRGYRGTTAAIIDLAMRSRDRPGVLQQSPRLSEPSSQRQHRAANRNSAVDELEVTNSLPG